MSLGLRPRFLRALLTLACLTLQLSIPLASHAAPAVKPVPPYQPDRSAALAKDTSLPEAQRRYYAHLAAQGGRRPLHETARVAKRRPDPAWARGRMQPASALDCRQWLTLFPNTEAFVRSYHSAVFDPVRNRMIVFGGYSESSTTNEVWVLPLSGIGSWSRLNVAGSPPDARVGASMVYDSNRDQLLVIDGNTDTGLANDVWALSLSGAGSPAWTQLTPAGGGPTPRANATAIYDATRQRVVLFGGGDGSGDLNDAWALQLTPSPAWSALTAAGTPPDPRDSHTAIYDAPRDRMVVFGGNGATNATWSLSFAGTPTWSMLAPTGTPPSARYGHNAVFDAPRNRMLVYGGYDSDLGADLGDLWALTLSGTPKWTQISPTGNSPWPSEYGSAVYDATGQRLVLFGGYGNAGGETWTVNLSGGAVWTQLPTPGQPPRQRSYPTAIYDAPRQRMVIFGGVSPAGYGMNDVWTFGLTSGGTWAQMFPSGTRPDGRNGQCGIFDPVRNRLIVFGGYGNDGLQLNDAWALTLTGTPTWTKLKPSGTPPSVRDGAAAIYDPVRDRMLIFGGHGDSYNNLDEVWALSLSGSGTWTQLTPSGTPGGRAYAGAAYDPVRDRLLIFGGPNLDTELWALNLSGAGSPAWNHLDVSLDLVGGLNYNALIVYDAAHDQLLYWDDGNAVYALPLAAASLVWTPYPIVGDPAPDLRDYYSLIYDSANARPVLMGGCCMYNDVVTVSAPNLATVVAEASPPGSGSVTIDPSDQSCFVPGSTVTLTAVTDAGFPFVGWGGDASGTDNPLTLTLDQSKHVIARFGAYRLTAVADPADGAAIDPADALFAQGAVVTVTVHPNPGFAFTGWSGDASGTDNPLTVTMDAPKSLVAHLSGLRLTTSVTPDLGGSIQRNPDQAAYQPGSTVTLTALHAAGFRFTGWSGDASGTTNPITITMDANKNVVANFQAGVLNCGDWVQVNGTQPPGRVYAAMAFDTQRERALLFGGFSGTLGIFNDVWALSMTTRQWSQLSPSGTAPVPRRFPGMIYDPVGDRLIVFGGSSSSGVLNDLWSLSLSGTPTWSHLSPAGSIPAARDEALFVYDPARNRAVLFGGNGATIFNDTWVLSLSGTPTWTQITTVDAPSPRYQSCAVFDPPHDRVVLFSGVTNVPTSSTPNDSWALNFAGTPNWTQLTPAGVAPYGRYATPGVYDPAHQRLIFADGYSFNPFGGVDGCYALSLKNEPAWITLPDQPVYRYFNAATFDPSLGAYVVFSGVSNALQDDTWMYGSGDYVLDAAAQPATEGSVTRSPNANCYSAGQVVQLTAVPRSGYVFTGWSGDASGTTNPLPVTLGAYKQIIAHFDNIPTATLLERFDASGSSEGIALRWRFGTPARVAGVALERAVNAAGPWSPIAAAVHEESGETVALDRVVEPNQEYFYRLNVALTDGSRATFGPVSSFGERIVESAITRLAPNPTSGSTSIQFAVAREGRVRIDVIDVAGRVVATPLDATRKPGHYAMSWEGGSTAGGRLASGLYWIRMATADRKVTQKLVLTR